MDRQEMTAKAKANTIWHIQDNMKGTTDDHREVVRLLRADLVILLRGEASEELLRDMMDGRSY